MTLAASAESSVPSQFSHIQRRFDARLDAVVATLHPGDYYVATGGELIRTVLGSCDRFLDSRRELPLQDSDGSP